MGMTSIAILLASLLGISLLRFFRVDLQWQLRYFMSALLRPAQIGIWQEDPILGWVHIPNSTGRHRKPLVYDVTYHIDDRGHRVTDAAYDRPKVIILGDSFAFGQGVEDEEAFPARLQEAFPTMKVVNAGVSAWSTSQALLALRQYVAEYTDIRLVIYEFITDDLTRNYRRKSWLDHIARSRGLRVPYFDIENERLVYRGLADPQGDGLPESDDLANKEREITKRMLAEMDALCRSASVPFVVVYLPDERQGDFSRDIAGVVGDDRFYDLRPKLDYASIRFGMLDGHPSPQGHRLIADAMAPVLRRFLVSVP